MPEAVFRALRAGGRAPGSSGEESCYHGGQLCSPIAVGRARAAARRVAILAAAAKRHVSNVRAFGSVVRGGDTADSDVDLLVDMDPTASPLDLLALGCDLEDVLGVKVDIGTPETLRRFLREPGARRGGPSWCRAVGMRPGWPTSATSKEEASLRALFTTHIGLG